MDLHAWRWAIEQFSGRFDARSREELDAAAPNHPVFLQASYYEAYLNSRALQRFGIDGPGKPHGRAAETTGAVTASRGRISEEASAPRHEAADAWCGPRISRRE